MEAPLHFNVQRLIIVGRTGPGEALPEGPGDQVAISPVSAMALSGQTLSTLFAKKKQLHSDRERGNLRLRVRSP